MFRKPFKLKSNCQIKGSERKKFRTQLSEQFPHFTSEDFNNLVPSKDEMIQMKLLTSSNHTVTVYCVGQNPAFFIDGQTIFPTVYTLWKFPDLLPTLTTWPLVFDKLVRGADLMLPGVILRPEEMPKIECLKAGDVCAIKLAGNKMAVAVGILVVSGKEIVTEGRKGKAMILTHIYTDLLYLHGDHTELPLIEDNISIGTEQIQDSDREETTSETILIESLDNVELCDNSDQTNDIVCSSTAECALIENSIKNTDDKEIKTDTEIMDELLIKCFLTALKSSGKNLQLPVLASTFYKSCILSCCPAECQIDIKKTSYKKVSNFLQEMKIKEIINVQELSKGIESITDVNLQHEMLRNFEIDPSFIADNSTKESNQESGKAKSYVMPEVKELHVVNASVLPIFQLMGYSKGSALTTPEVRKALTDYVKSNELQSKENRRKVTLDPVLTKALVSKGEDIISITWEDLHSRCISKMQQAHEITFPGKPPLFKKGKLNPIEINVEQRTGNKKVTLINHLDSLGIDPERFAHQIQIGVAASTKVGELPGNKGVQVFVQGNQVKYVGKMLLDIYKIPKKFVKGYDNLSSGRKTK